jgi:hypothetical protein
MAWEKLASDTLTGVADTVGTTFTTKKFQMAMIHLVDQNFNPRLRYNSNSDSEYAYRESANGGADTTQTSISNGGVIGNNGAVATFTTLSIVYCIDISTEEKLTIMHSVNQNSAGAGNSPARYEIVSKFVPSPDVSITEINAVNVGAGDFDTSSNVSVIGTD